jgi:hypothetical protein
LGLRRAIDLFDDRLLGIQVVNAVVIVATGGEGKRDANGSNKTNAHDLIPQNAR